MRSGEAVTHTLSVFQSLWAMEDLPFRDLRWSLAEQVDQIAVAGFAGLAVDLGARRAPAAADLAPLLRRSGLRSQVFCFVRDARDLDAALRYADTIGAEGIVVCGQVFPPAAEEAAVYVRGWLAMASAAGFPMQLETHRHTLTNDLAFTTRLLDAVPEVELAADLSHYVVGNELPDGQDARVDALVERVLARAGSLQGRIATRGQVQVSPSLPQHAAAVERFRGWWAAGMRSWRERHPDGGDLVFCCELGTTPYAITGVDGRELTDRWADALLLRDWARELFHATAPIGRTA
jgi:hypothetical protein